MIMKIYEKPLVDIKTFDVEDVMAVSGEFNANNGDIAAIMGDTDNPYNGVVFEW